MIAGAIQATRGTSILATDDQKTSQAGFRTHPALGVRCAFVGNDGMAMTVVPSSIFGEGVFTSKERDAETGLDYFGARYMSAAQGRFTSPDPAGLLAAKPGNPQSWNLYGYVMNNPLIYIDPNGLDCVNATNNQGGFTVNHDTDSGACGKSGGTWVPGYVDESWVHWNQKTGQYQVGSIDGSGSDATVDYATFKAGARTNDDGKCLSGCKGYGFASANADWLESQLVGSSKSGGLDGYMQFLTGREQKLGLGSKIAYGGVAFWKNNWAGPGGMGAPGGRGEREPRVDGVPLGDGRQSHATPQSQLPLQSGGADQRHPQGRGRE
jgi:RHS repeat-associated protein